MTLESANLRPEDQEAAMNLINASEFLREDDYAKEVVESGKADSGAEVDLGNFLAAREAILRLKSIEVGDPKAYKKAIAVPAVRGDLEKYVN